MLGIYCNQWFYSCELKKMMWLYDLSENDFQLKRDRQFGKFILFKGLDSCCLDVRVFGLCFSVVGFYLLDVQFCLDVYVCGVWLSSLRF